MSSFTPKPLPRAVVQRIYTAIVQSPMHMTLDAIATKFQAYSREQIYWACGTLIRQGIIKECASVRSDRTRPNPCFGRQGSFDTYVGWEEAK